MEIQLGAPPLQRIKPIWILVIFSMLLFLAFGLGAVIFDLYTGTCMFVFPVYFYAILVVYPILLLKRFGVGMLLFLPQAIIGQIPVYLFDYAQDHTLIGLWGLVGWIVVFLGYGLAADLAYRYAPERWGERGRAILVGLAFGGALYLFTLIALTAFYDIPANTGHLFYFQAGAGFSIPWMLLTGAFGGYTAYAIYRRV